MRIVYKISVFLIILACGKLHSQTVSVHQSEKLKIERITDRLFVHISYLETNDYGKVTCNGMVYINEEEAIIFDTPTTNEASKELIEWLADKKINAVVATHFHEDCLGGLGEFHSKGIPSYASNLTIEFAKKNTEILPQNGFDKAQKIKIGDETVSIIHFGQGHTLDNVVGYVPSENALFGGCLLKSLNAKKGYLGDANVLAWPMTVESIKVQYPNLKTVIPGHGKSGGAELLDYTIELFSKK
ncbi:subclass B1 metallo-beta-lactamase [Croceitalea rosinachiae]